MSELYWIPLATILLAGVIRGVYSSAQRIYGYSNPFLFGDPENDSVLGLLPSVIFQSGIIIFTGLFLLITTKEPLTDKAYVLLTTLIVGGSGIICLGHALIRSIDAAHLKYTGIVLSCGAMSLIFGLLASQFHRYPFSVPEAVLGGFVVGLFEILIRKFILQRFIEEGSVNLFPLWLLTFFTGTFGFEGMVGAVLASIPLVFIAVIFSHIIPRWIGIIGKIVSRGVVPFCIANRFRTIICEHCLRSSTPRLCTYKFGRRFCEHCGGELEFTHDPGKVAITFGHISLDSLSGKIFILKDIQHEFWGQQQIDVSEIYIDPHSCHLHLLERAITHLLYTPPTSGTSSVKIFYKGTFNALPVNLQNVLQNNFAHIAPFHLRSQSLKKSFEKKHINKNSIKVPAILEEKNDFSASLHYKVVLGGIIGVILGAASGGLVFLLSTIYGSISFSSLTKFALCVTSFSDGLIFLFSTINDSISFPAKFLGGAWLVTSFAIGGQKAKKSRLTTRQLLRWLIGIIILGQIAAAIISGLLTAISRSSPQKHTMANLQSIGTVLGSYQAEYNRFPPTDNSLWSLPELIKENKFVSPRYYRGSIYDAWGAPYYYVSDGESYTLISFGKDGKPGGHERFAKDIRCVSGRAPSCRPFF